APSLLPRCLTFSRLCRNAAYHVRLTFYTGLYMSDATNHNPAHNPAQPGPLRHFLQFRDFSRAEIEYVLGRARLIKDKFKRYKPHHTLHDRTLAMVFEKASTRTRVSFEAGMYQLGGSVIHLTTGASQLGRAEPIED